MTVADAARALEVSERMVYLLCREGRLAHHRIGTGRGVIRIAAADLDAYRARCRVEATDGPAPPPPHLGTGSAVPDLIGAALRRRGLS